MNKQEQPIEKSLLQETGDKLQMARHELDEFAVQLALGKTEARDKFMEMKKNFLKRLDEWNEAFTIEGKEDDVKKRIEILEAQLNVGGADEKKSFGYRIGKILAALEVVKVEISKKIKTAQHQTDFDHEVEMFRLKLEILRLKFSLKKFEVKEIFHVRMEEAREKIESITHEARGKIKSGKAKYSGFADEAELAYKHFRKAVEALQH